MTSNPAITIPRKIETTQAEFIYSDKSLLDCIKTILIPVSVNVSRSDRINVAIPNIPNCAGLRTLARTAILRNASARVTNLPTDINETPLMVSFVYPITQHYSNLLHQCHIA